MGIYIKSVISYLTYSRVNNFLLSSWHLPHAANTTGSRFYSRTVWICLHSKASSPTEGPCVVTVRMKVHLVGHCSERGCWGRVGAMLCLALGETVCRVNLVFLQREPPVPSALYRTTCREMAYLWQKRRAYQSHIQHDPETITQTEIRLIIIVLITQCEE